MWLANKWASKPGEHIGIEVAADSGVARWEDWT